MVTYVGCVLFLVTVDDDETGPVFKCRVLQKLVSRISERII